MTDGLMPSACCKYEEVLSETLYQFKKPFSIGE